MRVSDTLTLAGIVRLVDRVLAIAFTRIAFRVGVPIGPLTGTRKMDSIKTAPSSRLPN